MSRSACAIGKDVVEASFKGVSFWCVEADIEGGRRGAEGEFPFGEFTAYADLGRKIRVYRLHAVFREDNHVGDSSALFKACESPGPGILVHPTRGSHMVACRSVKVTDKLEETAGETIAEMEFFDANTAGGGLSSGGGKSLFGIISTDLLAVSQAVFLRDYTPQLVSHPWVVDVVDNAQHLIRTTATMATHVVVAESPQADWRDIINMQTVAYDAALARDAAIVDEALTDGFAIISRNEPSPAKRFTLFRTLANTAQITPNMPAGVAEESDEAIVNRFRLLSGVGMAEAAMGRKYKSVDEALHAMDIVAAVFADEAKIAYDECDNKLFIEIRNYSVEFVKMMYDLSYRLPPKLLINFGGGVHPLIAAYAVYNDAKRHRELEERNMVDANGRFGPIVSAISP
jgi:DNA circularisation protein N-terminus